MATLQSQIEKMFRDVTHGPELTDSIEVAVVGAAIGGLLGYAKDRNSRSAKTFALWGVGLGIAGQYMLFQMLKPAMRGGGVPGRFYVGEDAYVGDGAMMPATGCPGGTEWSDWYGQCIPHIPPPPPPQPFPASLSEWEAQHAHGEHFVGAVNRGGFRGGTGMPFGPGPWPNNHLPAPQEIGR